MVDLRSKYDGLLEIMREGFGEDLTWKSDSFTLRLQCLLSQFVVFGVPDEDDYEQILGDEWTWEHLDKVLQELFELGAINEFDVPVIEECEVIKQELQMIQEDNFYV